MKRVKNWLNSSKDVTLTFYNTITTFNYPVQATIWKKLWEKEKMLVTSIFSFSHNVFYPSQDKFQFLSLFFLSSANAFNLDLTKILSFRKELNI